MTGNNYIMQPNKSTQPTILILRFSSIGDIVLTTAAFELMKKNLPGVRLVLVLLDLIMGYRGTSIFG